jgi:hypothetical protein
MAVWVVFIFCLVIISIKKMRPIERGLRCDSLQKGCEESFLHRDYALQST